MTTIQSTLLPGLALTVGLSVPAQDLQGPGGNHLVGGPSSVMGQAHGIAVEDGVLWGLGPDYKASFTGGGMEYVPALGSEAPANRPLRLTLQSIARGGMVLYEAGAGPAPKAVRAGDAVVYHRSRQILERFEVRADGVELSYTFSDPLPGSGDLVVRARVDTDLAFRPTAEGGIRFLLDDIGGVRIGDVTGYDATRARAAGSLRWDAGVLEMRLPASLVDSAVYPLVLDPLVGTELMATGGSFNDADPSAAYDLTNDEYLVVWRRIFSGTNSDVRAQRMSGGGALLGSFLVVSLTGIGMNPTVANVNLRNRFLVAWQQAPSPFGPWDIFCRAVNAGTGGLSGTVTVASAVANETDPDAASENGIDDEALLVWSEEGGGIKGATITLPVTADPFVLSTATITSTAGAFQPAISTSHPSTTRYVVVWRESALFGPTSIKARAMNRNMTLLGTELTVSSAVFLSNSDLQRPDVDGDGTRFMVVYDRPESSTSDDRDVWCRMIQWTGSDLATAGSITAVANEGSDDELGPAVGWLNGKYVVLWMDRVGPFDYDVEGAELDANCQACGGTFRLDGLNSSASRNMELDPDIGTRAAGGSSSDHALIVFGEADWSPPFTSDIIAQRIEAFGGGPIVNLGGGCGSGGMAGTNGPAALGNSAFRLTLSGASPTAPFVFAGIDFVNLTNPCGPCSVMNTNNWLFVLPFAPGSAAYPLAIPCNATFQGLQVYSQWAAFLSGVNPCPLVPASAQVSFSNRIRMTLDF